MSPDPKGHLPFFEVKEKQAWRGRRSMLIGDQLLGAGSCRGQPLSAASIHASLEVCVCASLESKKQPHGSLLVPCFPLSSKEASCRIRAECMRERRGECDLLTQAFEDRLCCSCLYISAVDSFLCEKYHPSLECSSTMGRESMGAGDPGWRQPSPNALSMRKLCLQSLSPWQHE